MSDDTDVPEAASARDVARDPRADAKLQRLLRRHFTQAGNRVGVAVTLAASTTAVTFARSEVDALYGVQITPNWGTTTWTTAKATTGFTANFGTAAPASASFDWSTFRSED